MVHSSREQMKKTTSLANPTYHRKYILTTANNVIACNVHIILASRISDVPKLWRILVALQENQSENKKRKLTVSLKKRFSNNQSAFPACLDFSAQRVWKSRTLQLAISSISGHRRNICHCLADLWTYPS